jgi:hypothetical protein
MQMHVVPIQGIKPSTYFSVKRLTGHQALNIIEQKLQGIKPPTCWAMAPGHQALNLNEYAWTQHLTTWNIMNITYDSNNLDNILQLYDLDRHLQPYDINS